MKINMKISENHEKGNEYLNSFWFPHYRSDFLSILCFVSGCGNYSAGHFLILKVQTCSKVYDIGNLWKSALVVTLGFA